MHSTGVLDLSISLTGVKEKRGAHMSYMFLDRAAGLCFSFSLHAAAPPLTHAHAAARSTRRLHAASPSRRRRASSTPPAPLLSRIATAARVRRYLCATATAVHLSATATHRAAATHRSREVFDVLPDRDGSREEEGK